MASLGDPYSHYYDPSNYHSFQDNTTNPRIDGGIGVGIQASTPAGLLVGEAYPGTPAAKAGIAAGDTIVGADGHSFAGPPSEYAVDLIKGKVGTTVTLPVRRRRTTRTVRCARRTSTSRSPPALLHHDGVKLGYVDLSQFAQDAGAEVRAQVQNVLPRGGARAHPRPARQPRRTARAGGRDRVDLHPDGTIVSTDGRSIPREVYLAKGDAIPASIPLVVLVNRGTASSAEIVSAALQQRGRATLVGTHTYGKGVFQEIQPLLNGGALDFTVGEYFTPDGENLGAGGSDARAVGHRGPTSTSTDGAHQLTVAERVAVSELK